MFISVDMPGKQKQEDTVKVKQSNIATLRVHADNTITMEGKAILVNGIKRDLEERLLANEKLVVVLEIHPDADYGMMVACLDEVRLANAKKVSLKTTEL